MPAIEAAVGFQTTFKPHKNMVLDINTVVEIVGGALATALLGIISKGIISINQKIEKVLIDSNEHKVVIENHKGQFVDLWQKTADIDTHLQSTDRNIAALQERTKNMNR